MRASGRAGFTLIELLVVVSITALLMSILLPSLTKAKASARDTLCKTNLRSIYLAQTLLLQVRHKFQPLNPTEEDGDEDLYTHQFNYLIHDGWDWKYNFGPLTTNKKLLYDVKLLFCPFQKDPSHTQDGSNNPWPPNEGLPTRAAYGRRHLLTGKALSDFRKTIALFSDVVHLPKLIRSGHKFGVNTCYLDGHVAWVSDPGIFTNNDLGYPFSPFDNPIMDEIWRAMDHQQ